jgi:predicted metal-binding membrane protein
MSDRRFTSAFAGNQNSTGAVDAGTATKPRETRTAMVAVVTATLGLAAVCWVVAVWQMTGMDMGVSTDLGSFGSFAALWLAMMAAMMLPGAAPAVIKYVHAGRGVLAAPSFIGSYLVVWAIVGVAVYAVYRPHGSVVAAAVVIAAGVYELTPLKRYFRRRCSDNVRSGFEFGRCCVGSSLGLMLMLVALGVMNIAWMLALAVIVVAQKVLPAKAAVDVPIALAILGLGIFIVFAPASVPGLIPTM